MTGTIDRLHLVAFSADGNRLAGVTPDQRLRIWASKNGELLQTLHEPNHLNVQYSAIASAFTSKKGKKVAKHLVALGCESGDIVVWDINEGEILHRLNKERKGHSQRVNGLCFNAKGTMLYSCSADKTTLQWNLFTGLMTQSFNSGKHAPSVICLSPDESTLAVASSGIRLFDVSSAKCSAKMVGHASSVTSLAFSADGAVLFSTAANDRFINCFATNSRSRRSKADAIKTFSSSDSCRDVTSSPDGHYISAISGRQVLIWRVEEDASASVPAVPSCTISQKSLASFHGVRFVDERQVLVACGAALKPSFQKHAFIDEEGEIRESFAVDAADANLLVAGKEKRRSKRMEVDDGIECIDALKAAKKVKLSSKKANKLATELGRDPSEAVQLTMEERLESLQKKERDQNTTPNAGSLEVVLCQALASNDKSMLEFCIQNTNEALVQSTIERLPTSAIINLLDALVPRIDRHFAAWIWLRLLLAHHAAYFLSCTSGVDSSLAALHSALQSRLANHQPMLRLLGRLELLEAQRTMTHSTEENNEAKAEIVFQDRDSSDDDEEEEEAQEESDADSA